MSLPVNGGVVLIHCMDGTKESILAKKKEKHELNPGILPTSLMTIAQAMPRISFVR